MRALVLLSALLAAPLAAQPVETERGTSHTVEVAAGETLIVTLENWRYSPTASYPATVRLTRPDGTSEAPPAQDDFAPETYRLESKLVLRVPDAAPGTWTLTFEDSEPGYQDAITIEMVSTDAPPPLSLFEALDADDMAAFQAAIDRGDVYATGTRGRTPLAVAAAMGHADAMRRLLDAGADIEAMDAAYETPLSIAVDNARLDAVRLLLERGADASVSGTYGTLAEDAARLAEDESLSDEERQAFGAIARLLAE